MAQKVRNRSEQRMARMLQKSEGIKYTEALRRVRIWLEAKKETTDEEVVPQEAEDSETN